MDPSASDSEAESTVGSTAVSLAGKSSVIVVVVPETATPGETISISAQVSVGIPIVSVNAIK